MKNVLYCLLFIYFALFAYCYGALKKTPLLKKIGNNLPADLQNIVVEFCYGELNQKKLLLLLEKARKNKPFNKEELHLCEKLLTSANALDKFDNNKIAPIRSSFFSCLNKPITTESDIHNFQPLPYTTHPNILILKELLATLNRHNKFFEFSRGEKNLLLACPLGLQNMVNNLIKTGTNLDINEDIDKFDGPLHSAIRKGKNQIVAQLIKAGAPLNRLNILGQTPLHVAIQENNSIGAEMLINAGAILSRQYWHEQTTLHIAANKGNIRTLQLLLTAAHEREPETFIDFIKAEDDYGSTALHKAALSGNGETIRILLHYGANPNAVDCNGLRPLDYAINWGGQEAIAALAAHP